MHALALTLTALAGATPAPEEFDPEALARAWFETREIDPERPGLTFRDALQEGFCHLRLGTFDLWFPPHRYDDWSEAFVEAVVSVVQVQATWLEWTAPPGAENLARVREDLTSVLVWAEDLEARSLRKAAPGPGDDVVAALEPEPGVVEALGRLDEYFGRGGPVGPLEAEHRVQLILAPERTDFVQTLAVIGWTDPDWRHVYWSPDVVEWTHCEYAGMRVVALEFATPDARNDYTRSISMTQDNKRARAEHVVQLAARTLLESFHVPSLFAVALANNMTIQLFGEVDTRNDGDTSAREVGPVEIFVPGALNDGLLPAQDANSRWRRDLGEDYFVPALRRGQKDGAKKARSKWQKNLFFVLDSGSDRFYARAPFFGTGGEPPPDEFLPDFAEFQRAYRAGFLHWLREHGVEDDQERSHEAFGRFLARVAKGEDLGVALEAVYPQPLSKPDIDQDTLEGRFLEWLSEQ